ncbi:hypothetical protein [Micromonospora sp. NPDC005171]|uniref:hypothetical protein n=1 Tax=Micromonospora sp. NPDC005171 TaxID=3156866 RepID=UPI00339EE18F
MTSTMSGFEHLSGNEWQDLCVRVLHAHHGGGQFTEVADQEDGDAGLEGYSLDGCVYQCYAPENEPLDASARYRKQRRKMTTDVGKFIENKEKITKVVPPGYQAKMWILLVPVITTKRLLEHAHAQTVRLRAEALPYADSNIVVMPHTLRSYEDAKHRVIARQIERLQLPQVAAQDFQSIADPPIQTMNGKLSRTAGFNDANRRSRFIDRLLTNSVVGKEQREWIRDQYSELGTELEDQLSDLEARLEAQYPLDQPNPDHLLAAILRDTEEVVSGVLNVRKSQARVLAEGQVAQWLMDCPLDFP